MHRTRANHSTPIVKSSSTKVGDVAAPSSAATQSKETAVATAADDLTANGPGIAAYMNVEDVDSGWKQSQSKQHRQTRAIATPRPIPMALQSLAGRLKSDTDPRSDLHRLVLRAYGGPSEKSQRA